MPFQCQIVNANHYSLRYEGLKTQLARHYQEVTVQNYLDLANRSQAFEHWLNDSIQFDWVKAEVVKDSPSKTKSRAKKKNI